MIVAKVIIGVVLSAAALYAPFYYEPTINQVLSQAIYLAIAAMGLNLLTGFNGQVSIGHGAFFGVGAFTTRHPDDRPRLDLRAHDPGRRAGHHAVLGLLIGVPALRVRGLYLALVTLGLAVLFPPVAAEVRRRAPAAWPCCGRRRASSRR